MNKEKIVKEIIKVTNEKVKGFDNAKLVMALVSKFESEVRLDQCEKDSNKLLATLRNLNQNKDDDNT